MIAWKVLELICFAVVVVFASVFVSKVAGITDSFANVCLALSASFLWGTYTFNRYTAWARKDSESK